MTESNDSAVNLRIAALSEDIVRANAANVEVVDYLDVDVNGEIIRNKTYTFHLTMGTHAKL